MIQRPQLEDTSPENGQMPDENNEIRRMMFGPWSTNDPKIHRGVVRTNSSSGTLRRKFQATYPPAPTIVQGKTAITGGFQFTFNVVNGNRIAGYNVYSSTTNNPNVATRIRFIAQPASVNSTDTLVFQDITSASPLYWVASINGAGKESARIPASGAASPAANPSQPQPIGGGSGLGSGGGGGRVNRNAGIRGL